MTYNEKIEMVKKLLSSHVYEDKLIGIEMIDEDITNNVDRIKVTDWSGYHILNDINKGKGDLWDLIYIKYHPDKKYW